MKKDEACPITVQLRTSKSDAFFKLEVCTLYKQLFLTVHNVPVNNKARIST